MRRLATKDIRTAFLQSDKCLDTDPRKYITFKHPITKELLVYRQLAPIYGENSAPIRWEKTLFPFIKSLGFEKGDNEPCVFYHKERDLTVLVCVDDILADGYEEDIQWFFDAIADRFECKEDQWLTPETPIDFLGIDVSMGSDQCVK